MADAPVVTLQDGTSLTDEQRRLFVEFFTLFHATVETGVPQSKVSSKHHDDVAQAAAKLGARDETTAWILRWATPVTIRRYLVANLWNTSAAYEAILRTVKWRCENVPNPLPDFEEYRKCIDTRYMEWIGHDDVGRPILLIKSRYADLEISREDRTKYMIAMMEIGERLMQPDFSGKPGVERWVMVVDESGKEWKHMDNSFLSSVTPVVFANYVERLHKAYVVNPGTLTSMAITVIKLFVDDRTKAKLSTLHAKKQPDGTRLATDLLEQLGQANIPTSYGGTKPEESTDAVIKRVSCCLGRMNSTASPQHASAIPVATVA
jgi:hypothetical protein